MKLLDFKQTLKMLSRNFPDKALVLFLLITTALLGLLSPLLNGVLLNALHQNVSYWVIVKIVGAIMAIGLVDVSIGLYAEYIRLNSSAKLQERVRNALWGHLGRIGVQKVHCKSPGVWMQKVCGDVELVCGSFQEFTFSLINFILFFIGTASIIFYKAPFMFGFFLLVLGIGIIIHKYHTAIIVHRASHLRKGAYAFSSIIYDLLVMQPILRMVGLMNVFNDRFGRYNCLNAKQQKATQLAAMRHNGTLRIEMILVHGIMLASCVALYAHGKISLGDIWTYDLLMSQLIGGVNRLFEVMPQLDQGCESAKSLEEFFAIPEENDKQLVAEVLNGEIAICMQNVSFSYCNRANNTISHCNVTIKKGEAVCLMGRNGVGKSTFINLMVGILKPTSGKIDIGFSTPAVVPQRISIFRESILENVRLYDQSICAKKVRAVLGKCGMGKWLSNQRLGVYEKIIPENLSGGEIQRLAIARSMIRNPDLLILDEITNNLDLLEKQRITKILQSLKGKCTLVVISHDLDMLCLFDKVLVFNMGVIHEVAPNSDQNVYEKVRVMIGE